MPSGGGSVGYDDGGNRKASRLASVLELDSFAFVA